MTLCVVFSCALFQIWIHDVNDVHATISVSGLSFSYALGTLILAGANMTDSLGDLTDLDLCVAVVVGSMASMWASA